MNFKQKTLKTFWILRRLKGSIVLESPRKWFCMAANFWILKLIIWQCTGLNVLIPLKSNFELRALKMVFMFSALSYS